MYRESAESVIGLVGLAVMGQVCVGICQVSVTGFSRVGGVLR